MKLNQLTTIETVRQFPEGTQAVVFCIANTKQECYQWLQKTLVAFRLFLAGQGKQRSHYALPDEGYKLLSRPDKIKWVRLLYYCYLFPRG